MKSRVRLQAQLIVLLGFAISAAANVISYFNTVTQRGYHFNGFRVSVVPMLNPLMTIAALAAWWWLTRIEAGDERQRRNLQRAYLAFAAQYLLTTSFFLIVIDPFHILGTFWMTTSLWSDLIGAFVAAVGLVFLSLTLRSHTTIEEAEPKSDARRPIEPMAPIGRHSTGNHATKGA
jgi:zinc transporter ZupT